MPTPRETALARLWWTRKKARPAQLDPIGDWVVWLILTGRGWGKTRTGDEWLMWKAATIPSIRCAVVAPTFGDLRDICFEGESGLLTVAGRYGIGGDAYNPSRFLLTLPNGSIIKGYSSEKPDRLRGPQHHYAWAEELASWRYQEAWDMLRLGLRLGTHPRVVATTTPRPIPRIRGLLDDPTTHVTRGTTYENRDNLAPVTLSELERLYGGTRLGRQELAGEVLDDVEGALWRHATFDRWRVAAVEERVIRRVVGVDHAVTAKDTSDETGIIVAALGESGRVYVEADLSLRATPDVWAARVVEAIAEYDADSVMVETNQGGDLVSQVLTTAGVPRRMIREAYASKGKAARADPVALRYEHGEVVHVGTHPVLEDQCTAWVPGDRKQPGQGKSPDRIDALVWAVTGLLGRTLRPARLVAT